MSSEDATQVTSQANSLKPICLLIDTNIWREEHLLRTASGVALLYQLRQNNGVLGMPEVIESEITKQAVRAGKDYTAKIATAFRMLEALMGFRPNFSLPNDGEIEEAAKSRLGELEALFTRVPFTLEHAKSALNRVNSGLPPNGERNQQYKDSAIWEAALVLARSYLVFFITKDKGFYREFEKPTKGLADNLAKECEEHGVSIRIYSDIPSCLEHLRKGAVPLAPKKLADSIEAALNMVALAEAAEKRDYRFTGERNAESVSAFITERADTLSLTFELTYQLSDMTDDPSIIRLEPTLTAKGNCFYDQRTQSISGVLLDAEVFRWKDASGMDHMNSNHYARIESILSFGGKQTVPYTLRQPVE